MKNHFIPQTSWKNPIHVLAFGFGAGAIPKLPGTMGTLVIVPFYLLIQPLSFLFYIFVVCGLFLVGIWICGKTARDLNAPDHAAIVWDEMVGFLVALASQPADLISLLLAFLLFRLFDITKPWPISWVDKRVSGGLGIMLDDGMAGLYTFLTLWLTQILVK